MIDDFVVAYMDIVTKFHSIGAQWIQFDEPLPGARFVKEDIALFHQLYSKILSVKHSVHVFAPNIFWRYT